MPNKLFFELDKQIQDRIISASITEFATHGYENSSTNMIVKDCAISKGSLFKYFENKEDLYFFLIDTVMAEMARDMSDKISSLSKDLYERVIEYSTAEISWYAKNPVKGRFIIGVASEDDPDITKKIIGRYGKKSSDIYHELLSEVDLSCIKNDKEKAGDILQWVLEGFNRAFLENVSTERDIDELEREYISKLKEYLSVLKNGL